MNIRTILSAAVLSAAAVFVPLSTAAAFDRPQILSLKDGQVRQFELKAGKSGFPSVDIKYPVFTNMKVDEKILTFITFYSGNYLKTVHDIAAEMKGELPASFSSWTMTGDYGLSSPSPDYVSVTFQFNSYTGGAHGNVDIDTVTYDLNTGKELDFDDLFGDPGKALKIMSDYSYKVLKKKLLDMAFDDMLKPGTAPKKVNFDNLELTPTGVRIIFPPYQVAPWVAGTQSVLIPLKLLQPAAPSKAIWPNR